MRNIYSSILSSVFIISCGGSYETPPPADTSPPVPETSSTALYGYAIDGYISGANIFVDQNFNFTQDDNEFTAVTDTDGSFVIETND